MMTERSQKKSGASLSKVELDFHLRISSSQVPSASSTRPVGAAEAGEVAFPISSDLGPEVLAGSGSGWVVVLGAQMAKERGGGAAMLLKQNAPRTILFHPFPIFPSLNTSPSRKHCDLWFVFAGILALGAPNCRQISL